MHLEAPKVTLSHLGYHRKFLGALRVTEMYLDILRVSLSYLGCQRKFIEALSHFESPSVVHKIPSH